MALSELRDKSILVMGLGAHGGGAATARYCAESGARVTVTDLRSESDLSESLGGLSGLPIRFVLGEHREEDFRSADMVIKNPAVPRTSPYLRFAARVETDISLFLAQHTGPVCAITGTKGKSTTATALHHILSAEDSSVRLGGNITVSPLSFARELSGSEAVVLELSSFQLGDLLLTPAGRDGGFPHFVLAAVTNILHDHQDYYGSMADYARDKTVVFAGQRPTDWVVLSADDDISRSFHPGHPETTVRFTAGPLEDDTNAGFVGPAGFIRGSLVGASDLVEVVPADITLPGAHQRGNLLIAGLAAALLGVRPAVIRKQLRAFRGVPHRLEFVSSVDGVDFYNDSAATIADAALAAVRSFSRPVHLIAGGSDKGLPLELFAPIGEAASSVHLLAGSATERILSVPGFGSARRTGPHSSLAEAVEAARKAAGSGDVVLLSPGCASFGMFRNEFDRGNQFRSLVASLER